MTVIENIQARLIRRILAVNGLTPIAEDLDSPGRVFYGELIPSRQVGPMSDASPRTRPATLRWHGGLLSVGAKQVVAGCRLQLSRVIGGTIPGIAYEVLTAPRPIDRGVPMSMMEVSILPVDTLYPYPATIIRQDGSILRPVQVALWSEREDHGPTGGYEELSGEAPVEYATDLAEGVNVSLLVGDSRFRVVSSRVDVVGPRVTFDARRSHA